jgi:hypothetical protein
MVSAGIIFALTYMCTQFLSYMHPPALFPHHLSLLLVPLPNLGRTCFSLLFSDFVEEKRKK